MERPFADKRLLGPIFKQGNGHVLESTESTNLGDALIGLMTIRIADLSDATNDDTFKRENEPQILDRAKRVAIESLNDHLAIYAPSNEYVESNVSIVARERRINGEPIVDILDMYFWLDDTNRGGTIIDSDSWLFLQKNGRIVQNDIRKEFGADPKPSPDVSERDTVINVMSANYVPDEVDI